MLFALIAIKIKANAPGAHTFDCPPKPSKVPRSCVNSFPEIVLARHGKVAHLTYLFNGFATNMLVGACLVLGGSQVVAALTGMNVYAACFLIPLVVAAYVIAGGLRSTFIADYVHGKLDSSQFHWRRTFRANVWYSELCGVFAIEAMHNSVF